MMWFLFIVLLWESLLAAERKEITLVSICWLTAGLVVHHVWADAEWYCKNALKAVYSRLHASNGMQVSG